MKKLSIFLFLAATMLLIPACKHSTDNSNDKKTQEKDESDPSNTQDPNGNNPEDNNNGSEQESSGEEYAAVAFGDFSISFLKKYSDSVTIDETAKTITLAPADEKVEYTLSGSFDGQIINKTKNTVLILNNAALTNTTGVAAIYGELKTEIKAAEGSTNTVTVTGPEKAPDATKAPSSEPAIFCDKAIEIGGSGTLTVSCEYGHGVKGSKIELKGSGTYTFDGGDDSSAVNCNEFAVEADKTFTANFKNSKNGIKSDETITIASGTYNFDSITKVALKTDTAKDDATKEHFIKLDGGTFTFTNCTEEKFKKYSTEKDKFTKADAVVGDFD